MHAWKPGVLSVGFRPLSPPANDPSARARNGRSCRWHGPDASQALPVAGPDGLVAKARRAVLTDHGDVLADGRRKLSLLAANPFAKLSPSSPSRSADAPRSRR